MPPLNVPHYLQETDSSCLPACGCMVLDFLGIPHVERELRRLLRTKAYGTSILHVKQLESLAVDTAVRSGTLGELRLAIDSGQPTITLLWTGVLKHWEMENAIDYLHAVVVVGINDNSIQINDPAFSEHPISVSNEEFLEAWSYARQTMISIKRS